MSLVSVPSAEEVAERAVREHEQAMAASAARALEDRQRQDALHQARLADRRASHLQAPPLDLSFASSTPLAQLIETHASAFDSAIALGAQVSYCWCREPLANDSRLSTMRRSRTRTSTMRAPL